MLYLESRRYHQANGRAGDEIITLQLLEDALRSFQCGDLAGAERQLNALEVSDPNRAEVAALQGQVLRSAGRWPEAISWLERALERDPADPEPRIAIGQLHRLQGEEGAARSCFEQAVLHASFLLAANPAEASLLADLGLAYAELDDPDQAIEAFRAALTINPGHAETHQRLGALLSKLGRHSDAATCFEALLALNPGDCNALVNAAMGCHARGLLEEGLERLVCGRAITPADWNITYGLLFACSTGGGSLLPRLRATAREHWQRLRAALPSAPDPLPLSLPNQRLRVGILSAELGNHAVGRFLESFLRHYQRDRLEVELIETQARGETQNQTLRGLADHAFLLPERDHQRSWAMIEQRRYAVILETSGFTSASSLDLLVRRLAPVQCHYIGFHATTELDTIDWFIADPHLLPPTSKRSSVNGSGA